MGKFLDSTGVTYLWSKIKEKFIQRGGVSTDDIVDSAVTEDKIADGSITGKKFSSGLVLYMGQQLSYFKQVLVTYGEDPSTAIKSFVQRDYKTALYIKLSNGLIVPANTNGETVSGLYSYGNTVRKVIYDGTSWSDTEIQSDMIDTAHIVDGAVTGDKIANISITTDKLGMGCVTVDNIAPYAVNSQRIKDGAVIKDKIADYNIVESKFGNGVVSNRVIADRSVGASKLAPSVMQHLQAVTIYTDNTAESKAANVAAIKAYQDNVNSLVASGESRNTFVPIVLNDPDDAYKGIGFFSPANIILIGITLTDDLTNGWFQVASDGTYTGAFNANEADAEYRYAYKSDITSINEDLAFRAQPLRILPPESGSSYQAQNVKALTEYDAFMKRVTGDNTMLKGWIAPVEISNSSTDTQGIYFHNYTGRDVILAIPYGSTIQQWIYAVVDFKTGMYYAGAGLRDILEGNVNELTTISKTVIGAINEVNTLAKSKASTSVATQSANGLMSADDKKKLDGALAAIANNASVNAIDIVSYDETTNTYSGNAIEITGNIKSEIDIKNHTYLAANSTVDGHIESLDIALKNISDKVTNVATAANTAGKDAAAAQSALNTFKNRTEGFATAAQGTKADNSVQYDTNGKDVNLPDDGTLTVFGQITSQIGKLQLGANGESSYDITITSSNIEESPAIVFSESSNDVVLTGVANPINNNDVANKQYVDSKDNSPFIIDLYSVTNYDSSKTYSTTLTKEQVEKIHTNKSFLIKFPETSNDTSTADKIVSVNGGHYVHYETLLDIYDPQHAEKNTLQRITNVCRGMNAQMTKLFTSVANVVINYDANGGVSYTLAISAVITKDLN